MRKQTFRSFSGKSFHDFQKEYAIQVHSEIESKGKEYVLCVDEEEYKKYLKDKYYLEPLKIIIDSEDILEPIKVKINRQDPYRGNTYQIEAYECTIKYYFEGAPILFALKSNPWAMTSYEISVNSNDSSVSFSFMIDKQDPNLFNREKNEAYKSAFTNLSNLNAEVEKWNNSVNGLVDGTFQRIKQKLMSENSFFEAIKAKVDPNTKSVFTAPTIQKKSIPQPTAPKKQFTTVPTWPMELYEDTLTVLYQQGRSMEQKPSTYRDRDEEDIRDYLITLLETRYTATTVSGETFNKKGKTDILIKYQDGSNLFVGECKWWNGENEFNAAINQLFDRYLTWRDSKTALLFFVKNKEISAVCNKIKEAAQKHPYFKKFVISKGEGRYSFIFHLPGDPKKEVFLEIMAFHFLDIK
jgi:hypothetical protein